MRGPLFALICCFTHFANGASPAGGPLRAVACAEGTTMVSVSQKGQDVTLADAAQPAWIEFRELGRQIKLGARPEVPILQLSQPLRFASHWVRANSHSVIHIQVADSAAPFGDVQVSPHCVEAAQDQAHLRWLGQLGVVDEQINSSHSEASLRDALAMLSTLQQTASSGEDLALSVHYRALALFALHRSPEAVDEFGRAETAWLQLGESQRSQAAQVGRIEAQLASGRLSIVRMAGQRAAAASVPYFDTRIANAKCLALEELGDLRKARLCFQKVIAKYRSLSEANDQASALRNLANLERTLGNLSMARALSVEGLQVASGPYAPMTRGRLHSLLGIMDRQLGSVASAFQEMQLADEEFRNAGVESLSYRAHGRLYEAMLLEQVGSYYEAYSTLESIWSILSPGASGDLLPLSARVFADLERDTFHLDSALFWMRAAEEIYARLAMAPSYEVTRLARLQIQLEQEDYNAVERGLTQRRAEVPLYEPQWRLLEAGLAVKQNHLQMARVALDSVNAKPLSLRDQIRYALIEAEYLDRSGDAGAAQRVLLACTARLNALARQASSPTLRYVVARQVLPLQRAGLRMILEHRAARPEPETIGAIWRWIGMTGATRNAHVESRSTGKTAEAFDRAVAAELLDPASRGNAGADSATDRELFALLSQSTGPTNTRNDSASFIPLDAIQQSLNRDAAYVAILDGDAHGALLWITHDETILVDTASPSELRASSALLRGALSTPTSPVGEIQKYASTLSSQLLGAVPVRTLPAHLLVQSDELLQGITWSALAWPQQQKALIDRTAVEQVTLSPILSEANRYGDTLLHVIVASQQQVGAPALPNLPTAGREPELIRSVAGDRMLVISDGGTATRETVLAALAEPGAWVHIAAHGMAQPYRLGYAGLWLEPSGNDNAPPFLSWLDILDRGVRADLVVLNACRLGDSGNAIDGNMSFASAVARAGAKQVVAALWPVSDSASALWVTTFYAALDADAGHNAASALRAAQLRLRDSRAFRHPFFWAGMQTLSRLPFPAAGSEYASASTRQARAQPTP